jgi:deoxyribodipyrimidine photo-lyase
MPCRGTTLIQPERIKKLNDRLPQKGRFVLYWMQASQRTEYNHALEYAVSMANEHRVAPVVLFGLTDAFPEANLRHYTFMLEGLKNVEASLAKRGVRFVLRRQSPEKAACDMAKEASLIVTDRGYLRIQKAWREHVARCAPCPVIQVESDVVVPVEVASVKEEYAAATLRPKIQRLIDTYLLPLKETPVRKDSLSMRFGGLPIDDPGEILQSLSIEKAIPAVTTFRGGTSRAKTILVDFIEQKLKYYRDRRNDPGLDFSSHMSPYLHFGQVSPLYIALKVREKKGVSGEIKKAYLEELVVRRELSMNFVHYNPLYDSLDALPDWARRTLKEHDKDRREYTYSRSDLERARTHDPYWNAAQEEMVLTGKMHNYMRMYWGKKILEWTSTPEEAFRVALYLNNRYELDGRDPNGFAGVAWCFGKHDRPWTERKMFGKVRYMNAAGLERKFDIGAYVRKVNALKTSETPVAQKTSIDLHPV